MALNSTDGALDLNDDVALPMFVVERVQLQFSIAADFVAAQVANNVLVLALSNGRILRIDLNRPEDIDDIDLPKKPAEIGVIRRMFLDPTASHLLICTALGDNYYLHSQHKHPRALTRLRGVSIESVAWNPLLPTASTREILLGASDGNVYEASIETAAEFYKKDIKLKNLHKLPDGPITGLWADTLPGGRPDTRRVLIATQSRLFHLAGKVGNGQDSGGSIYSKLFEAEQPTIHELSRSSAAAASALVVSPDPPDQNPYEEDTRKRAYAWLSAQGIFHGQLASHAEGSKIFSESNLLPRSQLGSSDGPGRRNTTADFIEAIALTQWHIVNLIGGRVVAANRLTGEVVYDQTVLEPGQKAVSLCVDIQKNTFWLFTGQEIFEIVVNDEDRNVWQIMLQLQQFDAALQHAKSPLQRETVATSYGDHLIKKRQFMDAAAVYGRSNKAFEEVALTFIDNAEPDALRKYLLAKLGTLKKAAIMQRIMIASWLVEVFMAKLNSLDDTIVSQAELADGLSPAQSKEQHRAVQSEFQEFVTKYKSDLDKRTVYDVISSHGRELELLYFANAVNDYNYVLSYWVQRERWEEVLKVLKKQTDPEVFYRYSTVLMTHVASELVEILMRHADLKPRKLIPALLEYNRSFEGSLPQNQAIRYLQYVINQLNSKDSAVHNTLISMYASHNSNDEAGLLSYLESQGPEPYYDPDFALRLCIQHHRTLSCVHIYTNRPMNDPPLRKKLWLAVARKVISQSNGIKTAIDFLKRCELLKIEDLIPFFPDFVVIDDFKEEICTALEDYSRNIDALKKEMDESSQTATNIKVDIAALDHRYAIVEPGEKCYVCGLPLLSRQFFVFPCQHSFHSDCLGKRVLEQAGVGTGRRIRELQVQISKGLVNGTKREAMIAELDSLVASACILCSDFAIKRINEPFVTPQDNLNEWKI
ncbi:Vacuolar protein sorting-associated protein 18-like protein [Colletotrichum orbiculare MAFF 240422]|uniref:Vacuolar protein sorting-associated protein 18-like protein n=1 Tax=Colletotrichum orbiculare (strain 104-T / ATCC 96160 / CBS 514.97 / LARS 414 / MAFF 240422) TaxID=1213857 RepID=A0A484FJ92_COLOR|nr:Vacuolar protein sorting-associated protein 18-like protein [Colletotrichum orbiculare MAFF 240422]